MKAAEEAEEEEREEDEIVEVGASDFLGGRVGSTQKSVSMDRCIGRKQEEIQLGNSTLLVARGLHHHSQYVWPKTLAFAAEV